ncbi:unnamed protein product [Meganyctiphanes norvegica]|uniref:Calcium-activated chloride channel N-terminal domain-containing protein n=1 Tax=Meganyctiphanes norvegica TaxID=48144 RepID=A0AAV2PPZ5_MEGNR
MIFVTMERLLLSVCLVHATVVLGYQGDLRLVDNGYEGLVVSFSDHLPQQHCNQLIHGLKNVLSAFSADLYKSTQARASLREVTVVLPHTWQTDTLTCSLTSPINITAVDTPAHIRVSSNHPVFAARPWVQQSQGCGKPGDYIQLGGNLLRGTTNESYHQAAQQLLREWAKFRWGVFDEHGYENDPLFPATFYDPSSNELRPTSCLDIDRPFCSPDDHVPEAPTKHNAQCGGRAAWDIIFQSQDFSDDRNLSSNKTDAIIPNIQFVQAGPPRIVLVVEDTAVMNIQRRWEFVRKAVRRTVVYDMPDGAYVGVVVFNSVARTATAIAKIDSHSDIRQRIGSSLPRNPSQVPESQKCLLCGLQEALRALDSQYSEATGATVIFVTAGTSSTSQRELDDITHLATVRQIRIEAIVYPVLEHIYSTSVNKGLESLVFATRGSVFTIMDEGVGNDSKLSMMVALMDSFLAAVRHSTSSSSKVPLLVHNKEYPGGISPMAKGAFKIDDSFDSDLRFFIYYADLGHVGNTVDLITPSGKKVTSASMQEDGDANVIYINVPDAERGEWTYQIENRADSHQGLIIQATSSESTTRQISLKLWTNTNSMVTGGHEPSIPIIIYAEVMGGEIPILNARVVAKLRRLGTNATGTNYKPIYINLYDNGFGDPDITGGDGIYTRYIPQMTGLSGQYQLSVSGDNKNGLAKKPISNVVTRNSRMFYKGNEEKMCCGSMISYEHTISLKNFQRSETYGVLSVVSQTLRDTMPPNRILDLKTIVNPLTSLVTLQWTAPGNDYDWGKAQHYDAYFAESWAQVKALEGEIISGMPIPVTAGIEQSVEILVNKYDQIVYFAIRAIDASGNKGGVSNVAAVWMPQPPTTTPHTTTPNPRPTSLLIESISSGITQPVRVAGLEIEELALVIGAGAGFLLIIAILTTFCLINTVCRRHYQQKKDTKGVEGNRNIMIKTSSSLKMEQDKTSDSIESAVKILDNRPTLPSWSASKLLQEHERRFSTTSGPLMDAQLAGFPYQNMPQEPYPDVTLTGTSSDPTSETNSVAQSDPPAYQHSYTPDSYSIYPYAYQTNNTHEDVPPYTPQFPSSQNSQASTVYTHDMGSQSSAIHYSHDSPVYSNSVASYPPDMSGFVQIVQPPPLYTGYNDITHQQQAHHPKMPQSIAPKPNVNMRSAILTTVLDPKRRNVTQV